MDMDDPKKKFLLHIFFSNSVFSAFAQRGKGKDGRKRGVYQPFPDTKRKEKFKDFLREFLEKYVDIKWRGKKQLSSAELEDCMDKLKEEVDEGFSDILNKDNESKITFGTVQKLVNLYLKYLWCTRQIDFDPPHCPVDGQVLGKIDWDGPLWPAWRKEPTWPCSSTWCGTSPSAPACRTAACPAASGGSCSCGRNPGTV